MINEREAREIVAPWVNQDKEIGDARTVGMQEFDLGWVFWRVLPPGTPEDVGSGRAVVDRSNGELTYWPSVPAENVIDLYREYRAETPAAPLTWDPVARARHDRLRAPFPENVTHLRLADGRLRIGRSMKGDASPDLHPLVRDFFLQLPVQRRMRGSDRCSELAVISDTLHAEDSRRSAAGEPPLTAELVSDELLRGADLVTFQVREPGDPRSGQPTAPCLSCQALLEHFGFAGPTPTEDGQ